MSDMIDKANERRSALIAELKELESFIAMYRRLEGDWDARPRERKATNAARNKRAHSGRRQGSSSEVIVAAIRDIIREEGAPMNRSELVDALEFRGVPVGGIDKPRNIGTIVWRSKMFDSTDTGYWPKGVAPPGKLV
jgi:hypothetical protein